MIAKAASIAHTANALAYAGGKDKAEFLTSNRLAGTKPEEVRREFAEEQVLNGRCVKNTVAIVLSPAIEDGKTMNRDTFKNFAEDFMKRMQFERHQWVAYLHNDRQHRHIHIYANRINPEGRAYKDNFIKSRAIDAATQLAQEYGLHSAKIEAKEAAQKTGLLRRDILQAHREVMKDKPFDLFFYKGMMERMGVTVTEVQAHRDGKPFTQGLRYEVNGHSFKASEIDRSMSFANLQTDLKRNEASLGTRDNNGKETVRKRIFEIHIQVMKHRPMSLGQYIQHMETKGVRIAKIEAFKDGQKHVQGLRMEMDGHSFKASDIDRSMSFNRLKEDLAQTLPPKQKPAVSPASESKTVRFTKEGDKYLFFTSPESPGAQPGTKESITDFIGSLGKGAAAARGGEDEEEDQPKKKGRDNDMSM